MDKKHEVILEQQMAEGTRLANGKWSRFMEGLVGLDRSFTALVLENTDKYFRNMDETVRMMQIGNFDKFAFPMVRAIYPNLIAHEIVNVQPMMGPVSLIFYLDFVFGSAKGSTKQGASAFDAISGPAVGSNYSNEYVQDEQWATGNGSTKTRTGTLSYRTIRKGTLTIVSNTVTGIDDGAGAITGTGIDAGAINYVTGEISVTFGTAPSNGRVITATYRYDMEANENIPMIDLQLTSSPVTAQPRKLRARWSLEAAQNYAALHGQDAESELVGALAEQVKLEIDQEIISDLYTIAAGGNEEWDKKLPSGVSWVEHKLSFVDAIIRDSNKIFAATKRGQANFLIVSTTVADVIESLPTFVPFPGALQTPPTTGVIKAGVLNNRWTTYKSPFLGYGLTNPSIFLVGYKGSTFLEAGYVYAPYIPIYTTPTIVLDDFIARKGLATQYGKRVVNARFYATGRVVDTTTP